METITFTFYVETDFKDWLDMSLKLFKDYPPEETERGVRAILEKPNYQTFMAKEANKNIGFVTTSIRTDYVEGSSTSPTGYVDMVYVKPEYRKLGLAKKLFHRAESWAVEKGCTEMGSDTWLWNTDAQDFHEKIGFKKEEVLVHYIKNLKK